MQVIQNASSTEELTSLSIVEATLLLANTKFATLKFSIRTDISAACAAMILDLFDLRMVNLVFVTRDGVIDLRDPATFKELEKSSPAELAYELSVMPLKRIHPQCPPPHKELHEQISKLAELSPNIAVPILLKDFLLCGKTTVYINEILNDCTAWVYEELLEKNIISQRPAYLFFRAFELSENGRDLSVYVQTTARTILEQTYMKVNEDFQQFHSEQIQRKIYFATLILATCGYNWLSGSTKISPETFSKFDAKMHAMKQNLGAIARLPELRLQPEGQSAADVAVCIGICASLEESISEETRLY